MIFGQLCLPHNPRREISYGVRTRDKLSRVTFRSTSTTNSSHPTLYKILSYLAEPIRYVFVFFILCRESSFWVAATFSLNFWLSYAIILLTSLFLEWFSFELICPYLSFLRKAPKKKPEFWDAVFRKSEKKELGLLSNRFLLLGWNRLRSVPRF